MGRLDPLFRNRAGRPIDPWPFVVVTGLAFLLAFSFGPVYLLSFGLSLPWALAVSTLVFLGLLVAAYQRLVRTATPEFQREIPAAYRVRNLVYWAVAVALVLGGLSLPFLTELF